MILVSLGVKGVMYMSLYDGIPLKCFHSLGVPVLVMLSLLVSASLSDDN